MPRQSSGGRSRSSGRKSSSSSPRPASKPSPNPPAKGKSSSSSPRPASKPSPNPPAKAAPAPPPARRQGGSVIDGMVSAIVEGVVVGGVNAITDRLRDAVTRVVKHATAASPAPAPKSASMASGSNLEDACGVHYKAFKDCINTESDISKCQFYKDVLSECRRNSVGLNA